MAKVNFKTIHYKCLSLCLWCLEASLSPVLGSYTASVVQWKESDRGKIKAKAAALMRS